MPKEKKLAPKAERYCQLRVMGNDPLKAMEMAGYVVDQNAQLNVLVKRAKQYDTSPHLQARMEAIRTGQGLLEAENKAGISPAMFKKLDLDPTSGVVSIGWCNAAAFTIYQQALQTDNFHQALGVLKFMAEMNGFGQNLPKVGRPKHDDKPNDNQTSSNRDFDPDSGASEEDAVFDKIFGGSDGGDGKVSAGSGTSRARASAAVGKSSDDAEDDVDGSDELDQWDDGAGGEA